MSCLESRLIEALRTIREDDRHRHALEAEKLSRTQYREGFNLRKPTTTYTSLINNWHADGSSDEDFDVSHRKRKRRQSKRDNDYGEQVPRKRKTTSSSPSEHSPTALTAGIDGITNLALDSRSAGRDENYEAVEATPSTAFVILKFSSDQGREVLKRTSKLKGRRRKQLSEWEKYGGGFNRADRTALEQDKDFRQALDKIAEVAETIEGDELDALARTRSGKIRELPVVKKRKKSKKDSIPDDVDVEPTTNTAEEVTYPQPDMPPSQGSHRDPSPRPPAIPPHPEPTIPISSPDPVRGPSATRIPTLPTLTTLTTHFSHPIDFRCTKLDLCNFHHDYRFPLFGHGAITGQYLTYADQPAQLIELDSGHQSHNIPSDKMCVACAFRYLQITRCTRHSFTKIAGSTRRARFLADGGQAYIQDVFHDGKKANRNLKRPVDICRICPMPAVWRCCAVQERDCFLRPCCRLDESVEDASDRIRKSAPVSLTANPAVEEDLDVQPTKLGCGLALCPRCWVMVEEKCGGRLRGNRDLVLRESRTWQVIGARADVEFLFEEGLLWICYQVSKKRLT